MDNKILNLIQGNSPDGGFLQSEEWRKFQEAVGHKTFHISSSRELSSGQAKTGQELSSETLIFWANIIEHNLPIVGKYFYIPRGPLMCHPELACSARDSGSTQSGFRIKSGMTDIVDSAKKENIGWIRFDAVNAGILNLLGHQMSKYKILKAPHDMQPKELLIIDISKTEEELLAGMKPKTRYNIRVAEKKGVSVKVVAGQELSSGQAKTDQELSSDGAQCLEEFLRLVNITAKRQGINPHPEEYYRKMFETIPSENIKLYCAELEGEIIAANLVVFFGNTVTYLHGASDGRFRNVMAPYLLQWRQIQDAKKFGATKYDFGGVKTFTNYEPQTTNQSSWAGITRFKRSFSPSTKPVEFSGSYDIIISPIKYYLYRVLQSLRSKV